jgi:hypothetical protein
VYALCGQVKTDRIQPAAIALVVVLLALSWCASGQAAAAGCGPSVVEAGTGIPVVAAGEIEGRLFYADPSAAGRPATMPAGGQVAEGRNTKVLWVAEPGGGPLQVRGERTDGAGAFDASSPEALGPGGHYPSIIDLPEPGCWELTVSTAESSGTVTFLSRR